MNSPAGYKIIDTLFESRNTRVFKAIQDASNLPVILRTCSEPGATEEQYARLKTTHKVLEKLNHPNIVELVDWIDDKRHPWLVMKDTDSEGLSQFARRFEHQQVPVESFLNIAIQLADALSVVHHAQIIHKDLHPGNIIVNPQSEQVQIIDFGMASLLSREQSIVEPPENLEGILAYLSPEQTGRMNRAIDYRSDFYTLGVTFYQILSGQLPFQSDDPLGLVYAHIAIAPRPLTEVNPSIPLVLAEIIDKMLAKNAENRYQSALGLKHDLETCLNRMNENGDIAAFPLGRQDKSESLQIPQKLYGREKEVARLLAAYQGISDGESEFLSVAGYSGIGKSALVNEIHKPIAKNRGLFFSGKFDQFQQNLPYSAIKKALKGWLNLVLRYPEDTLASLRDKLLKDIGPNAAVLNEFMPEFEALLGGLETPTKLASQQTLARFNLVFQAFIKSVTSVQPWVVFIDDLQWADSGTLNLIPELIGLPECRLLLIVAYRDNELDEYHSAHQMFAKVAQMKEIRGIEFEKLTLTPLPLEDIERLLGDTLAQSQQAIAPLAALVFEKTNGNPFFTLEFLKALYRKGLLSFDLKGQCWSWDIVAITDEDITNNVVELMLQRLADLPEGTQAILQKAACIGSSFTLNTLATVSKQSASETEASLWPAIKNGLITPYRRSSRANERSEIRNEDSPASRFIEYKFVHDRMMQGAYESLDDASREATHLSIGRLLYASKSQAQIEESVFDLVEQLNHGLESLSDEQERQRIGALNLLAARKAKDASVWPAAQRYANIALSFLGAQPWSTDYEACFELHRIQAESLYLAGDFDQAELSYKTLFKQVKDPLDKMELLVDRLVQAIGRAEYQDAERLAHQSLALAGISLPQNEVDLRQLSDRLQTQLDTALTTTPISDFDSLPECTDRQVQLTTYALINSGAVALLSQKPANGSVYLKKNLLLTLEHGRSDLTPYTLATYGLALVEREEYEAAYEAGQKAIELLELYPNAREIAAMWNGVGLTLSNVKEPLEKSVEAYRKGFECGLQTGELARAGVCLSALPTQMWCAGYGAEEVLEHLLKAKAFVNQKQLRVPFLPIWENAVLSYLQHDNKLLDENFDPKILRAINNSTFRFSLDLVRFEYVFLDEVDCASLFSALKQAVDDCHLFIHHYLTVIFYCLSILALLRMKREGFFDSKNVEHLAVERELQNYHKILKKRAGIYGPNHDHLVALVEAEFLSLDNAPMNKVLEQFKRAIDNAEAHGFTQLAALSNEYYGNYLMAQGFEDLARAPLKKAYAWYGKSQCRIKLDILSQKYSFLSPSVNSEEATSLSGLTTLSSSTNTGLPGKHLDMGSLIKSTQAISSELNMTDLAEKVMKVAMENAGAQFGLLALKEGETLLIKARIGKETSHDICTPANILNLAMRSAEVINLGDACHKGEFILDDYVVTNKPKSLLCMPIEYRERVLGALYLENNIANDAFTDARLDVLKTLLTQTAISYENARLFKEVQDLNVGLEDKVHQRTEELNRAVAELQKANQELESFSYTVSHDLRSPLRTVKGYSQILQEEHDANLDDEARFLLKRISSSAEKMSDLINGLLDLSRVQRKDIVKQALDLSLMAQKTMAGLQEGEPGRHVDVLIAPDMKAEGDKRMLSSVLENLLGNAWKYTGKMAQASIVFDSFQKDGTTIYRVKDNGAGFNMAHIDKLFETFQRLHHQKDFAGTGVGLATVKRIIEKHGGRIWAESEENHGATFYFVLAEK